MTNFFPDNPDMTFEDFLTNYLERLNNFSESLDLQEAVNIIDTLTKNISDGKTIFTCGNGGSASIAEHFVCDLVKGTSTDSTVSPRAIPLLITPLLTAVANLCVVVYSYFFSVLFIKIVVGIS